MKKAKQIIYVENIFTSNNEEEFSKKVTDAVEDIITTHIGSEYIKQYYEGEKNAE